MSENIDPAIEPKFDSNDLSPQSAPEQTPPPRPHFPDPADVDLEIDEDKSTEPQKPKPADIPQPIDAVMDENKKLKDQLLRALADAENTRRRADRDRDDAMKYAISNFARGLLTVSDNLHRALSAIPDDLKSSDPRVGNLVMGIEATERDLMSAFDRVGIKKIDAMGQPFNAHHHEVMFEGPASGVAPSTIIQVIEDGYMIHDRLLRPARVGIAKAGLSGDPASHTVDTQA